MAEALKHLIDPTVVRDTGAHLQRAWPGFDRSGFERAALRGLDALALKARVMQLAQALASRLPADVPQALEVMVRSLGPADDSPEIELARLATTPAGLAGWAVWPLTEAVALIAIDQPAAGLAALREMTQRLTAEFAIRPFIVAHPQLALATMQGWCRHPNAHVRRLASEGSRPRLPWGLRLQALVADPSPTLPILRALQDDASGYVRRSVANHLNDIAKDHPGLVARWLAEHLSGASAERTALLRHASRGLVKAGDAAVLAAWGLGGAFKGEVALQLAPARLAIGDALHLQLTLASTARGPQALAIDYGVHHAGARGLRAPKVFKGWTLQLAPGEQRQLSRQHPFKPITTRRYHAGAHAVDVRINGRVVAQAAFELLAGD